MILSSMLKKMEFLSHRTKESYLSSFLSRRDPERRCPLTPRIMKKTPPLYVHCKSAVFSLHLPIFLVFLLPLLLLSSFSPLTEGKESKHVSLSSSSSFSSSSVERHCRREEDTSLFSSLPSLSGGDLIMYSTSPVGDNERERRKSLSHGSGKDRAEDDREENENVVDGENRGEKLFPVSQEKHGENKGSYRDEVEEDEEEEEDQGVLNRRIPHVREAPFLLEKSPLRFPYKVDFIAIAPSRGRSSSPHQPFPGMIPPLLVIAGTKEGVVTVYPYSSSRSYRDKLQPLASVHTGHRFPLVALTTFHRPLDETFIATIDTSGELRVHLVETEIFSFSPRLSRGERIQAKEDEERQEQVKLQESQPSVSSASSSASSEMSSLHDREREKEKKKKEKEMNTPPPNVEDTEQPTDDRRKDDKREKEEEKPFAPARVSRNLGMRLAVKLERDILVKHRFLASTSSRRITNLTAISFQGEKLFLLSDSLGWIVVLTRQGFLRGRVLVAEDDGEEEEDEREEEEGKKRRKTGGIIHVAHKAGVTVFSTRRAFAQFNVASLDVGTFSLRAVDGTSPIVSIALDPKKQTRLAVALQDGEVLIYDLKKNTLLQKFSVFSPSIALDLFFFKDVLLGISSSLRKKRRRLLKKRRRRQSMCGNFITRFDLSASRETSLPRYHTDFFPSSSFFSLGEECLVNGLTASYHFGDTQAIALVCTPENSQKEGRKERGEEGHTSVVRLFDILHRHAPPPSEEDSWAGFHFRFPILIVAIVAIVFFQLFRTRGTTLFSKYDDYSSGVKKFFSQYDRHAMNSPYRRRPSDDSFLLHHHFPRRSRLSGRRHLDGFKEEEADEEFQRRRRSRNIFTREGVDDEEREQEEEGQGKRKQGYWCGASPSSPPASYFFS
ncbi:hypothetical protein CSUI_003640 [Cystoisospora suis]|uniref:Transmembrane protein n=1 Tax=Cystoisospora suis TaxID=483139 RepID=A0A2C6L4P1_9APIC|nr:hypothetical protein CSUI_003640 [Cystoisospora suis]